MIAGELLFQQLAHNNPSALRDLEAWVVNTVKLAMIKKLDNYLEADGRTLSRKLFLVPIFSVANFTKRIEEFAPELKTLYYKELMSAVVVAEKRLM